MQITRGSSALHHFDVGQRAADDLTLYSDVAFITNTEA
jgi:hypothetical protein